ncbi:MAG: CIA30 family protein [Burkholderiaceae bacterium]
MAKADDPLTLFDFREPVGVSAWSPVDDRVMGGISVSTLRHDPTGHAVFQGTVSLERNGGFASARSSPGQRGMHGAEVCLVEIRGASKRFKLSLLTDDVFEALNYQASFLPTGSDSQTTHLPISAFRATFRGREVADAPQLDSGRIRKVGLMIADRQAGPFALDIRRISLA